MEVKNKFKINSRQFNEDLRNLFKDSIYLDKVTSVAQSNIECCSEYDLEIETTFPNLQESLNFQNKLLEIIKK